jgi:hypothetical protein
MSNGSNMMKKRFLSPALLLAAGLACNAWGQVDSTQMTTQAPAVSPPAAVTNLTAKDTDNDHGHAITLSWTKSADDGGGTGAVLKYDIFRYTSDGGSDSLVGFVASGETSWTHTGSREESANDYIPDNTDFWYRVDAVTADSTVRTASAIVGPVQSYGQWYNTGRTVVFIFVLGFGCATLFFVRHAKKGKDLYIRPLAGLEAVDDAIGRATEMGKPILYVFGMGTAADIATIASFSILGRVAKRVAENKTDIIVPCSDPVVFTVAQEIVRSSFLDAGRPDSFKEEMVYFVTQNQFAYVGAINGTMLRERPATNVYMGKFYAESLLLAETGASAGSIQIAGTDEVAQIPFFVVACDYTLIGEELYAASAYLSREPLLLGSLKAQDLAKAAVLIITAVGAVALNFDWPTFKELFKVVN